MHGKTIEQVLKELSASSSGLLQHEAEERLKKYGLNEIQEGKKISPLEILASQFKSIVIWILIFATLVSAFLKEYIDSIVILVIVVLIGILGFVQEYKAEKAIEALKKLASLKATAIRNGQKKEIDSKSLVPGDIIVLETGDKVPADARLMEILNFSTQEAALTGESQPVKKQTSPIQEKATLADMSNMVFSGTIVVSGRAKAIVIATGMKTEIGKIARMIEQVKPEPTPLQKRMDQLGKWLGKVVLVVAAVIFVVGMIVQKKGIFEMLKLSAAVAVAAIPEALAGVVTITLALGTKRMLKRNALIRRLPSVETLGSTTVICTDKTGTLTANQMTVTKLFVNGRIIEVTGVGLDTKGQFLYKNKPAGIDELELLLRIGALNNNSELKENELVGDPTEGALVVSAAKAGLIKEDLEMEFQRFDEIEFTSERKMMTTIHKRHGEKIAYSKGAPEMVLKACSHIYINGNTRNLTDEMKKEILETNKEFADEALRVLGFAYKPVVSDKDPESSMIFVGLQAMIDPPREEVRPAIEKCKKAGIKVVMITGDHEITAKAVARDIGLAGKVITGQQLEEIKNLEDWVEEVSIFARVNPEHKIKIVEALKKKGHIVAMTGDGVNDAPALKRADIGIAMGITGTDVSKEASSMILMDDNFASIVNAVEEGRGTYDNIKKYFAYLISGNIGEIAIILLSIIFRLPLPLTVTQILIINLVMDGPCAISMAAESYEPDVMSRKPKKQDEAIYKDITPYLFYFPIVMLVVVLSVFIYYYNTSSVLKATTMAFVTITMARLFETFTCKSLTQNAHKIGFFSNRWLVGAVAFSFAVVLVSLYVPAFNEIADTTPISFAELLAAIALSSLGAITIELVKYFKTRKIIVPAGDY